MTLINEYDVQDYMGRQLAGGEVSAASVLCVDVQAQLEGWLGRVLEVAEYSEDVTVYPLETFVPLSFTPVVAVSSLVVDGDAWPVGTWGVERSGVRLVTSASVLTTFSTSDTLTASVTYTAGLGAPATSAARLILKGRIQRLLDKRASDELGLKSLSIDRYRTDWLDEDFFTDRELKSMERWKRRVVSTEPGPPMMGDPWYAGW